MYNHFLMVIPTKIYSAIISDQIIVLATNESDHGTEAGYYDF